MRCGNCGRPRITLAEIESGQYIGAHAALRCWDGKQCETFAARMARMAQGDAAQHRKGAR